MLLIANTNASVNYLFTLDFFSKCGFIRRAESTLLELQIVEILFEYWWHKYFRVLIPIFLCNHSEIKVRKCSRSFVRHSDVWFFLDALSSAGSATGRRSSFSYLGFSSKIMKGCAHLQLQWHCSCCNVRHGTKQPPSICKKIRIITCQTMPLLPCSTYTFRDRDFSKPAKNYLSCTPHYSRRTR